MSALRKLASITVVSALVVVGAGCGGSDDGANKVADKAAEKSAGGDVDVDGPDGTVKYTGKDGDKIEYGANASLPKGWPADLEPPASVTLLTSSTTTTDGQKVMFISAESDASFDDLYAGIKAQLTEGGYDITTDSKIDSIGSGFAGFEATKGKLTVSISLAEGSAATDGKATVLINITPEA